MECIIAYLLLGLFVDLLHALVTIANIEDDTAWINRRLWSDHRYDCRSRPVRYNVLVQQQQPDNVSCARHLRNGAAVRGLLSVKGEWKMAEVLFRRRLPCRSVLR